MSIAGCHEELLRKCVKVQLTDSQQRDLAKKAKAMGMTVSAYSRSVLLKTLEPTMGCLPEVSAPNRKHAPLRNRLRIQFTDGQVEALKLKASSVGMYPTAYCRWAILDSMGLKSDQKPKNPRTVLLGKVTAELCRVNFHLKKLGANVNQLAHQANTGMVPITRAELQYVLNQQQVVMSQLSASLEKLLR